MTHHIFQQMAHFEVEVTEFIPPENAYFRNWYHHPSDLWSATVTLGGVVMASYLWTTDRKAASWDARISGKTVLTAAHVSDIPEKMIYAVGVGLQKALHSNGTDRLMWDAATTRRD